MTIIGEVLIAYIRILSIRMARNQNTVKIGPLNGAVIATLNTDKELKLITYLFIQEIQMMTEVESLDLEINGQLKTLALI